MGWGRMLLLGNWGQQMDIEDQREEIASLRRQMRHRSSIREVGSLDKRVKELEKENDELHLYLASLVRYLGNKGILEREEFCSLVEVVDGEDGDVDGRFEGYIVE